MPRTVASRAVRSYRTFSPLPDEVRRFVFCGTFHGLAPSRHYLAPCPKEPGLSSDTRGISDCLADSGFSGPRILLHLPRDAAATALDNLIVNNIMTIKLSIDTESMSSPSAEYEVIWLIRRLFRAMGHEADQYLKSHGLSAADRAVLEFLHPDTALSVPEIASRYEVSRQHVQVTVNALVEDGFLELRSNPRHKRSPLIALTRVGRDLFAKIRRVEQTFVDALFADIAEDDIEAARRTLEAMYYHNLKRGN